MIKIPRFMKEYASYQIKSMYENSLISEDVKAKAIAKISKSQSLYGRGLITITEAMNAICHCFED